MLPQRDVRPTTPMLLATPPIHTRSCGGGPSDSISGMITMHSPNDEFGDERHRGGWRATAGTPTHVSDTP
jgi:hypothetical protein